MTTIEKISKLRQKMHEKSINAFIVYSADPHMSEYLPEEWQERTWLSGFTGSAGFLVVTNEKPLYGQMEDISFRQHRSWKTQE